MAEKKMLMKERVLTMGSGERRAVLCFDSGLVYQYSDPSNVLAYYVSGKGWLIRKKPYYSSGGWGNSGSGDAVGSYLMSHAAELIESIGGRLFRLDSFEFITAKELSNIEREIKAHNSLVKKQNEMAKRLGNFRIEADEIREIPSLKISLVSAGNSAKGIDPIETAKKFETSVETFLKGKGRTTKVDGYTVTPNQVYQERKAISWGDAGKRIEETVKRIVAFRNAAGIVMNSELLSVSDFERKFLGGQSLIQKKIRESAGLSIPFNVLESAGLKLTETKVLERGPESTHNLKNGQTRHFTGALLLENSGRKFLMDIDRVEISHGIFNAFFVEVNADVSTISDAYESMKPTEIKTAEKSGQKVLRQGEWFFVETDKTVSVDSDDIESWDQRNEKQKSGKQFVLRHNVSHGKGRPNSLYRPVNFGPELDGLVCGTVSHSGREHADLDLGKTTDQKTGIVTLKLWKLVPNSTVSNFTIQGDID